MKRSHYGDIAGADKRAVHGNTFTYVIAALATVVEDIRQIMSFYKRHLALAKFTAKNKHTPSTFWQSADPVQASRELASPRANYAPFSFSKNA